MTKQGTLAYYLAAWVVGCFVVTSLLVLQIWVTGTDYDRTGGFAEVLKVYFVALIFGAVDSLVFAFLLRRIMRNHGSVWLWMAAGGVLASLLALLFVRLGAADPSLSGSVLMLVLAPSNLIVGMRIWWQVPLDGAAIAAVLFLVNRAFNRAEEQPQAQSRVA
jgi:hypothetical protein